MDKLDHALKVAKAGVAAIPFVGRPLASLMSDYIPTAWQRSINQFCRHLEEEVTRLGDRLDTEHVDKNEMADLIQRAIHTSIKTTRQEKTQAAATIVANAILSPDDPDKISYTELDHFLNAVDSLSVGAFHVLATSTRIPPSNSTGARLNRGRPNEIRFNSSDLVDRIPEFEPDIVISLVAELDNWNLLRRGSVSVESIDSHKGYVTNLPIYLTKPGRKFVQFILQQ